MPDLLFSALNNHTCHLTPEQSDAITERWNELVLEPLHSPEERSEIFKAFVKRVLYENDFRKTLKEEPEIKPVEPTPTVPKRCKLCGMVAEAGWRYIGPRTLDVICYPCQEKNRQMDRPARDAQQTLSWKVEQ